jgi:hypothetical protein
MRSMTSASAVRLSYVGIGWMTLKLEVVQLAQVAPSVARDVPLRGDVVQDCQVVRKITTEVRIPRVRLGKLVNIPSAFVRTYQPTGNTGS